MTLSINNTEMIVDLVGNEMINSSHNISLKYYEYVPDGNIYIYIYILL